MSQAGTPPVITPMPGNSKISMKRLSEWGTDTSRCRAISMPLPVTPGSVPQSVADSPERRLISGFASRGSWFEPRAEMLPIELIDDYQSPQYSRSL